MTQKTTSHETVSYASQTLRSSEGDREFTKLEYRYGEIGILAVAAAVRYAGGRKNPAYAPVPLPVEVEERFIEIAA